MWLVSLGAWSGIASLHLLNQKLIHAMFDELVSGDKRTEGRYLKRPMVDGRRCVALLEGVF